jgi:hypothetical protein
MSCLKPNRLRRSVTEQGFSVQKVEMLSKEIYKVAIERRQLQAMTGKPLSSNKSKPRGNEPNLEPKTHVCWRVWCEPGEFLSLSARLAQAGSLIVRAIFGFYD